jgi:membrane fusion protein (multidrug efflux system)
LPNRKSGGSGGYDLIPGQYAPVRLILGENANALLIPQPALVESQIGKQVFVVNADNKVETRKVEIGRGYQGQWIIKKGLKKGEKVIVEGTQKVRPGMVVKPKAYASKKVKTKKSDG